MSDDSLNPYASPQPELVEASAAENPRTRGEELVVQFERGVTDLVDLAIYQRGADYHRQNFQRFLSFAFLAFLVGLALQEVLPMLGWLSFAVAIGMLVLGQHRFSRKRLRTFFSELYGSESFEDILGRTEVSISPQGISELTMAGSSFTPWASIKSIERTDEFLVFSVNLASAYQIPLRAFPNVQTAEEYLETALAFQKDKPNSLTESTAAESKGLLPAQPEA